MSNKYTQDMTGTGQHIELPDPEPERYYDWMLWKLRQDPKWKAMKQKTREPFIRQMLKMDSLVLAVIYTLGHIIIAMNVVYFMTGASIWEAGAVALVEPIINGCWFFILHILYKKIKSE
jgi:uncharacterized membrane protein